MGDETANDRRTEDKVGSGGAAGIATLEGTETGGDVGGPPGGGPDDGGLPDLKQPPGEIEGAGGGPSLPSGPTFSHATKANCQEAGQAFGDAAKVAGYAAAGLIGIPGLDLLGAAVAGAAVGLALDAMLANAIANDPPQPYQEIVSFQRRASTPPGLGDPDPVLAALAIASQYAFFAGATAGGALAAGERLAGAIAADDYNWAVTHQGVLRQAIARLPVDLALVAAAQRAAGLAIRGTPVDSKLSPGQKGAGKWIGDPGNEAALSQYLEQAGYTSRQTAEGIAWMRSDPPYQGQPSTVSEQLVLAAERLYQTAERLAAQLN